MLKYVVRMNIHLWHSIFWWSTVQTVLKGIVFIMYWLLLFHTICEIPWLQPIMAGQISLCHIDEIIDSKYFWWLEKKLDSMFNVDWWSVQMFLMVSSLFLVNALVLCTGTIEATNYGYIVKPLSFRAFPSWYVRPNFQHHIFLSVCSYCYCSSSCMSKKTWVVFVWWSLVLVFYFQPSYCKVHDFPCPAVSVRFKFQCLCFFSPCFLGSFQICMNSVQNTHASRAPQGRAPQVLMWSYL